MYSTYWNGHGGTGAFDLTFPFGRGRINRHSRVVASICEIAQPPGEELDYPFIGGASMRVLNIAPQDDGNVVLRIEIDWDSGLNWRVTFFIDP
jgi:hypothetical protein